MHFFLQPCYLSSSAFAAHRILLHTSVWNHAKLMFHETFHYLLKFTTPASFLHSIFQLYDFHSPNECPTNLAYHPSKQLFTVGFDNGAVRVFDIQATSLIADHWYVYIVYLNTQISKIMS